MPPTDRPVPDAAAYSATVRALQHLDPVERAAVVLVYWHGRTQPQVAADLDISVGAARRAVNRGLRRVAEQILAADARSEVADGRAGVNGRRRP